MQEAPRTANCSRAQIAALEGQAPESTSFSLRRGKLLIRLAYLGTYLGRTHPSSFCSSCRMESYSGKARTTDNAHRGGHAAFPRVTNYGWAKTAPSEVPKATPTGFTTGSGRSLPQLITRQLLDRSVAHGKR